MNCPLLLSNPLVRMLVVAVAALAALHVANAQAADIRIGFAEKRLRQLH